MNRKPITTTVKDADIRSFQRDIARAGGKIVSSCFTARGYTVTYVL